MNDHHPPALQALHIERTLPEAPKSSRVPLPHSRKGAPVCAVLAILASVFVTSCWRNLPRPPVRVSFAEVLPPLSPEEQGRSAERALALGNKEASRGEDSRASFREAVEAYSALLQRDPEYVSALLGRAEALQCLGDALEKEGEDPREAFKRAMADATRVLEKDRTRAEAFLRRAGVNLRLGDLEMEAKGESKPYHQEAIADYHEAERLGLDPSRFELNRGIAYNAVGVASLKDGTEARPSFQQAIAIFTAILERSPDSVAAYTHRGGAYSGLAMALRRHQKSAGWAVDRAFADCAEAIRMDPEREAPYFTRGRIYASMGDEENAAGKDPRANFARAIEDFDRALERSPKFRDAWLHRGMIRGALGFSEDALGDFEKAGELTRGEDEHLKRMIEQERRLTELPRWARALLRAENLVRWADRAGARRLFEASFSEFEGKVDVKEMKMDGLVMFAYMHLARIYSLASAGKSGPGAKPEPLPEVEKEELRQKALLQIRKALEIGFNQFDFLRKDPQLAAVQGLPEFQSLLKEFEEKGK